MIRLWALTSLNWDPFHGDDLCLAFHVLISSDEQVIPIPEHSSCQVYDISAILTMRVRRASSKLHALVPASEMKSPGRFVRPRIIHPARVHYIVHGSIACRTIDALRRCSVTSLKNINEYTANTVMHMSKDAVGMRSNSLFNVMIHC